MTRTHLFTSCAIVLLVTNACAQAGKSAGDAALSVEEAVAIALDAQPGTIGEAELDTFEGKTVYDIEVVNAAGDEVEFKIDAQTGDILNTWTDDDPKDDPVSGSAEDALD